MVVSTTAPGGATAPHGSQQLGPYRIVRELGRGGMGIVHEAEHLRLGHRVAIKRLKTSHADDPESVQRFAREGRAACRVRHPNVVEVHELFDHDGMPYLVMELLEGTHLGAHLAQVGPMPLPELVALTVPVISGAASAHAVGVVHRDLKPSNIMLTRPYAGAIVPKVLDFGASKLSGFTGDEALTATGAVLGTLQYMSPEQLAQPRAAGPASDQYSLGAIIYECATGKRPFVGDSYYAQMQAIMTAPLHPASSLRPELPAAFDRVLARALSRNPSERFRSLADLGLALLFFGGDELRAIWEPQLRALSEAAASHPDARGATTHVDAGLESAREPELATTSPDPDRSAPAAERSQTRLPRAARVTALAIGGATVAAVLAGLGAGALDRAGADGPPHTRTRAERSEAAGPVTPIGSIDAIDPARGAPNAMQRDAIQARIGQPAPAPPASATDVGPLPSRSRHAERKSTVTPPSEPDGEPDRTVPAPTSETASPHAKPSASEATDARAKPGKRRAHPRTPRDGPRPRRVDPTAPSPPLLELGDNGAPILE